MNCIITAGPTFEPLDEVRRLTNFSTGRLGTELANYLVTRGHHVTLLLGDSATWSGEQHAQKIMRFSSTGDLREKLKACSRKKVHALFHAAAVNDFAFGKMFTRDTDGNLRRFTPSKKISTRGSQLLVELVPTPKIIAELRAWYPRTCIVGWKFEADGGRADAVQRAQKQITDCSTDGCVANGPAYGRGFAIVTAGAQKHFATADKLFAALEDFAVGNFAH